MDTNEIAVIVVASLLSVRVAMWVSSRKQKVSAPKDAKVDGSTLPGSGKPSNTLGQHTLPWRLSDKDNLTSRMLMRTELIGYGVNEALLVILTSAGLYYLYASLVATESAQLVKFFANDLRTFKDRRSGRMVVRLLKFNLVSLVGMGVNLTILYLATTYLDLPYSAANLIGIAATIPLYFIHLRFTWKRTVKEGVEQKGISAPEEYR